jgi:hypothetical protein
VNRYYHGPYPIPHMSMWNGWPQRAARSGEMRDLGDFFEVQARYHRDMSGYETPVYAVSQTHQTPGAPLSVFHDGMEQTRLDNSLGLFQLSDSEKQFGILLAAGALAYFFWKRKR